MLFSELTVVTVRQFGTIGQASNYSTVGGHDFYDFPVNHPTSKELPEKFGGCSGGGLWHVLLTEKEGGELAVDQILLQGLAYYQKPPQNGWSALKCHGPKSIYDFAFTAVERISR